MSVDRIVGAKAEADRKTPKGFSVLPMAGLSGNARKKIRDKYGMSADEYLGMLVEHIERAWRGA